MVRYCLDTTPGPLLYITDNYGQILPSETLLHGHYFTRAIPISQAYHSTANIYCRQLRSDTAWTLLHLAQHRTTNTDNHGQKLMPRRLYYATNTKVHRNQHTVYCTNKDHFKCILHSLMHVTGWNTQSTTLLHCEKKQWGLCQLGCLCYRFAQY